MSNSIPQAKGLINLSNAIDNAIQSEKTPHEITRIKYKIDVKEVIPQPQIAWSITNTDL